MKKFLALCIVSIILMSLLPAQLLAADSYHVVIDDFEVTHTDATGYPFVDENNRTLVPLRVAMETYGCGVEWIGSLQEIRVTFDNGYILLKIGSNIMQINIFDEGSDGTSITTIVNKELDTKPIVKNGRTYLPLRPVFEAMGAGVHWDPTFFTIYVYHPGRDHYMSQTGQVLSKEGEEVQTDPDRRKVTHKWIYYHNGLEWNMEWSDDLSIQLYNHLRNLDRKKIGYDVNTFVNNVDDDGVIARLTKEFQDSAKEYNLSAYEMVELAISFVQSLEFIEDMTWTDGAMEEYYKFPYETLYDRAGDCEDTSMLLYVILRELGYGCCLITLPGHMAVGIKGGDTITGTYFDRDGYKFFYIETTGIGWKIGEMPEQFSVNDAVLLFP